jgi:hypothetical protein
MSFPRMILPRLPSGVSRGKINFSKAKIVIALLVASVLITDHAENQS